MVSSEELAAFPQLFDVSVSWLTGVDDADEDLDDKVLLAARDLTNLKKEDLDKVLKLLKSMRSKS